MPPQTPAPNTSNTATANTTKPAEETTATETSGAAGPVAPPAVRFDEEMATAVGKRFAGMRQAYLEHGLTKHPELMKDRLGVMGGLETIDPFAILVRAYPVKPIDDEESKMIREKEAKELYDSSRRTLGDIDRNSYIYRGEFGAVNKAVDVYRALYAKGGDLSKLEAPESLTGKSSQAELNAVMHWLKQRTRILENGAVMLVDPTKIENNQPAPLGVIVDHSTEAHFVSDWEQVWGKGFLNMGKVGKGSGPLRVAEIARDENGEKALNTAIDLIGGVSSNQKKDGQKILREQFFDKLPKDPDAAAKAAVGLVEVGSIDPDALKKDDTKKPKVVQAGEKIPDRIKQPAAQAQTTAGQKDGAK